MPKPLPKPGFVPLATIVALVSYLLTPIYAQPRPTVAPETQTTNLPAQRIGANDLLGLLVYGTPELTGTMRVSADGFIRLPMIKQRVKVQGLMPAEVEAAVAEALRGEHIIVDPYVTVTVVEYKSYPISVVGAVNQPLIFQATGPCTLLEAITRAGGLAPQAGPEILITHPGAGPDDTLPPRSNAF